MLGNALLKGDGPKNSRSSLPPLTILSVSLVLGFFLIYPNIAKLIQGTHAEYLKNGSTIGYVFFFLFRYLYFSLLCYYVLKESVAHGFGKRYFLTGLKTFALSATAYVLYVMISYASDKVLDWFSVILLFQFMTMWSVCTLIAYAYTLYAQKRDREQEIETLKLEKLQSQYEALAKQVNPHFFFNALNTLSALVRSQQEQQTLAYIQNLSNVFRYILRSEGKTLVPLDAELNFLSAFQYLQQIRYGEYLRYDVDVRNSEEEYVMPALSLLPVLENIPKHNVIDSEHQMLIKIKLNDRNELVVSNPIRRKMERAPLPGTGLENLRNRTRLLLGRDINIVEDHYSFTVTMPLKANR